MVSQAIELIYYTWKKTLQFLMSATIGTDGVGSVSLLFIIFAVFLFGILFRFFLSVPRTYRGERDVSSVSAYNELSVNFGDGTSYSHTKYMRNRGKIF